MPRINAGHTPGRVGTNKRHAGDRAAPPAGRHLSRGRRQHSSSPSAHEEGRVTKERDVLVWKAARRRVQLAHPLFAHDYVRRAAAIKRVVERCKKMRECPYCAALNGLVKKVGSMRIVHAA